MALVLILAVMIRAAEPGLAEGYLLIFDRKNLLQ
jgi:hypothetical protein